MAMHSNQVGRGGRDVVNTRGLESGDNRQFVNHNNSMHFAIDGALSVAGQHHKLGSVDRCSASSAFHLQLFGGGRERGCNNRFDDIEELMEVCGQRAD